MKNKITIIDIQITWLESHVVSLVYFQITAIDAFTYR
jgi:hypothetical protein